MKLKNIERRKKPKICLECGGGISSQGINWVCNKCGKCFRKVRRFILDRTGRPSCPFCNSERVNEHGAARYCCASCGRTWSKIYHPKVPKGISFENLIEGRETEI